MRRPAWIAFTAVLSSLSFASAAQGAVVISQVYGGGGNSGGTFQNDFIELHNNGTTAVDVSGYSVQYGSATSAVSQKTNLTGSIPAGGYYLVQEAAGTANPPQPALPTPDATGTIALSATSGKVVLASTQTQLTCGAAQSPCTGTAAVVDTVGYGTSSEFEGTAATPALTSSTAALRAGGGCTDTNDNRADFTTPAPVPRNSAAPAVACGGGTPPANAAPTITCPASIKATVAPGSTTRTITASDADGTVTSIALVSDGGTGATLSGFAAEDGATPAQVTLTVPTDTARSGSVVLRAANSDAPAQSVDCTIAVTVAPPTPISAIQGSGLASPLVGQDVTIEGVVTGIDDEQGASFGSGNSINRFPGDAGIYVQTEGAGDGDDATSEGIFVGFVGAAGGDGPRSQFLGKRIRLNGRVVEQFGFTQINETINQEPVIVAGNGLPTQPTPITLDPAQAAAQAVTPGGSVTGTRPYYERYEGMRVRLATGVANSGGTNKFGELFVTPGTIKDRVFRTEAQPDLISVDADAGAGNPSNPFIPAAQSTTYVKADLFDTVSGAIGPLGFSFGNYKITPQEGPDEPTVAETGVPYPYDGVPPKPSSTVRVTAFNVENFFPVGGQLDGGTVTAAEFAERRDEIADAIDRLLKRPDVVGVEEVADLASLQAVAAKLGGYTAYLEEGNDNRGIDVGFLIKDTVTATNVRQLGKTAPGSCSDVAGLLFDRPPLAVDITTPNGRKFTMINNHFASKAAPDSCREAQAAFVRDQVVAVEAAGGEAVVSGDLNAFEDESALTTLEGPETSLDNLWDTAPAQERYSFAFQGKLQTLDHILITDGLTSNAFQYAHFDIDYYERESTTDGHKTSDHDPPLATLADDGGGGTVGPSTGPTGATGPTGQTGATGPTGPAGTNGANGTTGPTGPAGTNGQNGTTGPRGADGTNGQNGTNAGKGDKGEKGDTVVGPAGPAGPGGVGPAGPSGATGPRGPRGLSGTLNVNVTRFRATGRSLSVRLRNRNAFTVTGRLSVRLGGRALKTVGYRTAANQTRTFRVVLSRSAYRRVQRAGRGARLTLHLTGAATAGASRTSSVPVKNA